jgi:hypothetical protein
MFFAVVGFLRGEVNEDFRPSKIFLVSITIKSVQINGRLERLGGSTPYAKPSKWIFLYISLLGTHFMPVGLPK